MSPPSDPFQELAYFQRRMNRLLQESLRGPRLILRSEISLERPAWAPKVNIYWRNEEEIVIFVELPGVSSSDEVNLEFRESLLAISGVRRLPDLGERAEPLVTEGNFGPFHRLITLPEDIDASSITAKMKAGVLEIHASKRQRKGPLRVEIVKLE